MLRVLGLALFAIFLNNVCAQVDQTLVVGAGDCQIVEAVLARLLVSNVFPPDNGFLRRIAYAETRAGLMSPPAGRKGLWAVSSDMFAMTKTNNSVLVDFKTDLTNSTILRGLNGQPLDWSTVLEQDLDRPLYSAIAARLYLEVARKANALPSRLDYQADFWAMHYASSVNQTSVLVNTFLERTRQMDDQCACKASIDMVFVMDMSSSVGRENFAKARTFVKNIAASFEISPNRTRVGLVTYSGHSSRIEFELNELSTKESVFAAINSTTYRGGGTQTGRAIRLMMQVFNSSKTATSGTPATTKSAPTTAAPTTEQVTTRRLNPTGGPDLGGGLPETEAPLTTMAPTTPAQLEPVEIKSKVGIVVTDGQSHDDVLKPSLEAHSLGINMFAIGVGGYRLSELNEIASDPDQAHVFTVGDYNAIENIRASVRRRSCLASAPIDIGQPITGVISIGEATFVEIGIPENEDAVTINLEAVDGSLALYTSFSVPNPSEALHDQKLVLTNGETGSLVASQDPNKQRQSVNRQRRQTSTEQSSNKLYVSIVGQAKTNKYVMKSEITDPSVFNDSGSEQTQSTVTDPFNDSKSGQTRPTVASPLALCLAVILSAFLPLFA